MSTQIEPESSHWLFYIKFLSFYIYRLKYFPVSQREKSSEGSGNDFTEEWLRVHRLWSERKLVSNLCNLHIYGKVFKSLSFSSYI